MRTSRLVPLWIGSLAVLLLLIDVLFVNRQVGVLAIGLLLFAIVLTLLARDQPDEPDPD